MWLKIAIVILFVAVVASLASSLMFLFKDTTSESKRSLYALGVRVTLAATLLLLIGYGIYTGQLVSTAPWDSAL